MPNILAFAAHPDDETYSFGGTLTLAAQAGWRCVVCVATNGEMGERHDGGHATPEILAGVRQSECRAACRVLGAEPVFWNLPDGGLLDLPPQQDRVRDAIGEYGPDIILSLGPDGAYGHPDHVALALWVTAAWRDLGRRPPLLQAAFPAGLFAPQYERCCSSGIMGDPPLVRPAELGSAPPDYAIDIAPVAATKLRAIAAHHSQLPGGEPRRLFPPGIVDALLALERFSDANAEAGRDVLRLLKTFAECQLTDENARSMKPGLDSIR